jgi:hypothetical protein
MKHDKFISNHMSGCMLLIITNIILEHKRTELFKYHSINCVILLN